MRIRLTKRHQTVKIRGRVIDEAKASPLSIFEVRDTEITQVHNTASAAYAWKQIAQDQNGFSTDLQTLGARELTLTIRASPLRSRRGC